LIGAEIQAAVDDLLTKKKAQVKRKLEVERRAAKLAKTPAGASTGSDKTCDV